MDEALVPLLEDLIEGLLTILNSSSGEPADLLLSLWVLHTHGAHTCINTKHIHMGNKKTPPKPDWLQQASVGKAGPGKWLLGRDQWTCQTSHQFMFAQHT